MLLDWEHLGKIRETCIVDKPQELVLVQRDLGSALWDKCMGLIENSAKAKTVA